MQIGQIREVINALVQAGYISRDSRDVAVKSVMDFFAIETEESKRREAARIERVKAFESTDESFIKGVEAFEKLIEKSHAEADKFLCKACSNKDHDSCPLVEGCTCCKNTTDNM